MRAVLSLVYDHLFASTRTNNLQSLVQCNEVKGRLSVHQLHAVLTPAEVRAWTKSSRSTGPPLRAHLPPDWWPDARAAHSRVKLS